MSIALIQSAAILTGGATVFLKLTNTPSDFASDATEETAYLTTATLILNECVIRLFSEMGDVYSRARSVVLKAPVLEEVLFRTLFQGGIKQIQHYGFQYFRGPATQAQLDSQKTFRIWTTAIAFGLIHAANPHETLALKITQVYLCTFSGLSYCHLKEKTGSTAPSIFCHAFNNFLALTSVAGLLSPVTSLFFALSWKGFLYSQVTGESNTRMFCHTVTHITLFVATLVGSVPAIVAVIGIDILILTV